MFMTGARPFTNVTSGRTATMLPVFGFWILMAIIVVVTAMIIELQAEVIS